MKAVEARCPSCGADLPVTGGKELCTCEYCGAHVFIVDTDSPSVPSGNPAEDAEFARRLTLARNLERTLYTHGFYATRYNSLVGYDAVMACFQYAGEVGAARSEYWLALSHFYVNANLFCFRKRTRVLKSRALFLQEYITYIDNAIRFCTGDPQKLIEEKDWTLSTLQKELQSIPERPNGCYVATAVYRSYDCPPVWVLRRFRDKALAPSRAGRAFIRFYYAVSPALVRRFGRSQLFRGACRALLDPLVARLRRRGFADTPYWDAV